MRDTPALKRRVITRNVPPKVTPTSIRRHGLFTPRGIFKKGHWNVRRLFSPDTIPEVSRLPTYLQDDTRSAASPFLASSSPPLPRYRFDRSISWERKPPEMSDSPFIKRSTQMYSSPESDIDFSPGFKPPVYDYAFSGPDSSPAVIKGPTRFYSPPESDASFSPVYEEPDYEYASSEYDTSPASTIKESSYGFWSSGSDRSSPSPIISRRFNRSPSPLFDSDSGSAFTYKRDMSPDTSSDRSHQRTFGTRDTPAIMGRRCVITRNIPPEVTPTSARRYGLFTPRGIFKKRHWNVRRLFSPDSPYLSDDATPGRPFPPSTRHRLDRTISWEKSTGLSPEYLHQPSVSKSPVSPVITRPTSIYSPSESDAAYKFAFPQYDRSPSVIKGPSRTYSSPESAASYSPVFKGPAYLFAFPQFDTSPSVVKGPARAYSSPESDASYSPVIKGPSHMFAFPGHDRSPTGYQSSYSDRSSPPSVSCRSFYSDPSPFSETDSRGASPYQLEMSPDTPYDRSHQQTFGKSDTPAIMGRGRVITRNIPPEVTPTSTRRYGLFTPRGIFKKRHWNVRRLFDSDSPYLSDDGGSRIRPFPPSPRYRFNRTMSWEKSDEFPPEYLNRPSTSQPLESSDSPVIKWPTRIYSSSEPDTSFSPSFKEPANKFTSSESDRSPAVIKGANIMYSSPEQDRSFSPVFKGSVFSEYDRSSSSEINGSHYRYPLSDLDDSSPSPLINRGFRREISPLSDIAPSGYESEFERSLTPRSIIMNDSSSSNQADRTRDRSFSPDYPGRLPDDARQLDDPLSRRWELDGLFQSGRMSDSSPAVIKGANIIYSSPDRSSSSEINGSHYRYPLSDSNHSSPSPLINRGFRREISFLSDTQPSGYESEFERSLTPRSIIMNDSSSSNQADRTRDRSFSPDYLGRLPDDATQLDDPLNRRWELDGLFQSGRMSDSSPGDSINYTFDSSSSYHNRSNQDDPLNRRLRLSELFASRRTPDRSYSSGFARTPDEHFSPAGTSIPYIDSPDSIHSISGYAEGSLNDPLILDETQYYDCI